MTRIGPPLVCALALACACSPPSSPPPPQVSSATQELSGREGKVDYDVDAPWRVEPVVQTDGTLDYGPVPIQITIVDAHLAGADDYVQLGDLIDVTVQQHIASEEVGSAFPPDPQVYQLEDLAEIEFEGGPWPYTGLDDAVERTRPTHGICEPWRGQSCEGARNVGATAKWYALAWYDLNDSDAEIGPGDDVPLEVTVRVEAQLAPDEAYGTLELRGHLLVHLGEAPLPEFGRGWVYGDLHYHSQGTQNEGESGHPYRGVVRAMGTMGLNFAFATDHASYSEHLVDLDVTLNAQNVLDIDMTWGGLRDLSPERFRYLIERLHDPINGANLTANQNQNDIALQSVRQRGIVPKLFLGAEVDAAPETTYSERWAGIKFGNGRRHHFDQLCHDVPDALEPLVDAFLGTGWSCDVEDFTEPSSDSGNTYFVLDWQGLGLARARQHILHLPTTADPEGFVPSRTSQWGGGTRRIHEVLGAIGEGGVSFLAHPLSSQTTPHPGPNVVPYSEYSLRRAFAEPTMLGLQIWNEDARLHTGSGDPGFFNSGAFDYLTSTVPGVDFDGRGPGDCDDAPSQTCSLEVVPTAGVITTHMWEWAKSGTPTFGPMPAPFAPNDDARGLYSSLHHGAYTWDQMNLWGLTPNKTSDLTWLPPGDPRRVFASGGSDAHGDFNYRRAGYFIGTEEVNTTAIGTPRNLVDISPSLDLAELPGLRMAAGGIALPTVITQDAVTDALRAGRFSVTDGPALRIVIDRNRNGVIDADDVPMGGISHLYGDDKIPLLVEWKSTPEFGPVDQVHIYVAAVTNGAGRIYAPGGHGVRTPADPTDALTLTYVGDDGKYYYRFEDNYYLDPTAYGETLVDDDPEGQLTIRTAYQAGGDEAYHNVVAIEIDPAQYPSGYGETTGMFVRAFARTAPEKWNDCDTLAEGEDLHRRGKCLVRLAYTNPIWALPQDWTVGDDCPEDTRGIDGDGDGLPDGCDWCPDDPMACGPDSAARVWTQGFGSTNTDLIEAVAHDPDGNVFVAGHFQGTAYFMGEALTSDGAFDGFIAKISRTGELLWIKHLGGSGNMRIHALVADELGVITLAGWFRGRLKLDSTHILDATDDDMYVVSFDGNASSGTPYLRWVRQFGGAGRDVLRALAIGPDNSVYAAGSFSNKLYLYGKSSGDAFSPKTSSGGYDCIMMRFQRTNGIVTGSRQIWGSGYCAAEGLAVQANHDVAIAGRYTGEARFDPSSAGGVRTAGSDYNGYVAVYRPTSVSGSTISSSYYARWNVSLGDGGGCANGDARATGVADQGGSLVAVGHFKRCATALSNEGNEAIGDPSDDYFHGFAVRLDGYGGIHRFATGDGLNGDVYFSDVSANEHGYAISGAMKGALAHVGDAWFGGWTPLGSRAAIAVYLRSDDVATWGARVGGNGSDYAHSVSLFRDGFFALVGDFQQTLLTPNAGSVPTRGGTDGFVYQTRPE